MANLTYRIKDFLFGPYDTKTNLAGEPSAYLTSPTGMLVSGPGANDILRGLTGGNYENSAVYACLSAYVKLYAEPHMRLYAGSYQDIEKSQAADDHRVYRIIRRPNDSRIQTWKILMKWAKWMTKTDGNAYFVKVREGGGDIITNTTGRVLQLWPVSPMRMQPYTVKGSGDFISYYALDAGHGQHHKIPRENVIHLIDQIDDRDMRRGVGAVRHILREKITDEESNLFVSAIMANAGVPGLVISPQGEIEFDEDDAEVIKRKILLKTTGDKRGEPLVLASAAKVDQYGFDPESMALSAVWSHLEQRIAGVLNIPPVLAGLGAGLEAATYSNIRTARAMFVEDTLFSDWAQDGEALTMQLGGDFALSDGEYLAFDWTNVRALQDAALDWRKWALNAWELNGITLSEFYRLSSVGEPDKSVADMRLHELAPLPSSFSGGTKTLTEKRGWDDFYKEESLHGPAAEDLAKHYERLKNKIVKKIESS